MTARLRHLRGPLDPVPVHRAAAAENGAHCRTVATHGRSVSVLAGADGRRRAPVSDLETSSLIASGDGKSALREPFAPGCTGPRHKHPSNANVQVKTFCPNSEWKVVRGAATLVGHCHG